MTREVIDSLHPAKVVRLGGAGHKCLNLVMNRTDSWVHPVAGLGNWDLCASESLVKSMGGYTTDIFGQKLVYKPSDRKVKGVILARSPQMHSLMLRRMNTIARKVMSNFKL